jgi:hypothetical protein
MSNVDSHTPIADESKPTPLMGDREYLDWVHQQVASRVTGNMLKLWAAIGGVAVLLLGALGSYMIKSGETALKTSLETSVYNKVTTLVEGQVGQILVRSTRVEELLKDEALVILTEEARNAARSHVERAFKDIDKLIEGALGDGAVLLKVLTERAERDFDELPVGDKERRDLLHDIGKFGRGDPPSMSFLVEKGLKSPNPYEREAALLAYSRPRGSPGPVLHEHMAVGIEQLKQEPEAARDKPDLSPAYEEFFGTFPEEHNTTLGQALVSIEDGVTGRKRQCLASAMSRVSAAGALEGFLGILNRHDTDDIPPVVAQVVWRTIGKLDLSAVPDSERLSALVRLWHPIRRRLQVARPVITRTSHASVELDQRLLELRQQLNGVMERAQGGYFSRTSHASVESDPQFREFSQRLNDIGERALRGDLNASDPVFSEALGSPTLARYLKRLSSALATGGSGRLALDGAAEVFQNKDSTGMCSVRSLCAVVCFRLNSHPSGTYSGARPRNGESWTKASGQLALVAILAQEFWRAFAAFGAKRSSARTTRRHCATSWLTGFLRMPESCTTGL